MKQVIDRKYNGNPVPAGDKITFVDGKPRCPDRPIIPYIEGDGTGPDILRAAKRVLDAGVEKSYGGKRSIAWFEVFAGERAHNEFDSWLPEDSLAAIREFGVAIKGPLTTPVGGGIRSLNVTLRQVFDLYCCVRPVKHFPGVPSPVMSPEKLDVVIFRENTEDVYAGIEYPVHSPEAKKLIEVIAGFGQTIRADSGIGIKPISRFCSQRLVRRSIEYALGHKRRSVTLVHKGNIMKFTEGAFRDWGYELAEAEFSTSTVSEERLAKEHSGKLPEGKVLINDRIADSMFQQVLTRPDEYSVIATSNLNGDYLSDACVAQVGGLGMAPGANIGDNCAIFEATHGTAPKYANLDVINPGSVILSGALMFEFLGWVEAARLVREALGKTVQKKLVTYDLERLMTGATRLKTSEFASAIIENM